MPRKNPVLLRPSFFGGVNVLTNYRRTNVRGKELLEVVGDGRHDVTADFDAIVLEYLFPKGKECSQFTAALDGAADGDELDRRERAALRRVRTRLVALIERHNTTGHGRDS